MTGRILFALFAVSAFMPIYGADEVSRNRVRSIYNTKNQKNILVEHPSYSYSKIFEPKKRLRLKTNKFNKTYNPRALAVVNEVFEDFGDLYIDTNYDMLNKSFEVKAKKTPWSGYWYPLRKQEIYPVLQKYDNLLRSLGKISDIKEKEKHLDDIHKPDDWEGMCDARSYASINTKEPTKEIEINGETFSVIEQKALLTFAHTRFKNKKYGITYSGNKATDGTYDDIRPEAFHKIITHILGKERRALIVDISSGIEVWNKPAFKFRWKINKDENYNDSYLVKGYLTVVDQRKEEKLGALTNEDDFLTYFYEYRLAVDTPNENGMAKVLAGEWIERSATNHPDNIKIPILNSNISSRNAEFNKYIDIFQKVFPF